MKIPDIDGFIDTVLAFFDHAYETKTLFIFLALIIVFGLWFLFN